MLRFPRILHFNFMEFWNFFLVRVDLYKFKKKTSWQKIGNPLNDIMFYSYFNFEIPVW